MKVFAFAALLVLFGGACGDDRRGLGGSGPDGGSDGSGGGSDAPDGGMPMPRVTIVTGYPPALIAYREETTTAWRTPASPSAGRFELEVAGPYRVIVVCSSSDRVAVVGQFARTLDDERTIEWMCGHAIERPFHVRGTMLQSGFVAFAGGGRGKSDAPWSFDLATAAGTFDFLAFFGGLTTGFDQVAIHRDVAISGDLDLGMIDVATEHTQALVPTRFTATNLTPDESLDSFVTLQSGNTFTGISVFSQPEQAWQVTLVPAAALRATDTQDVQLSATSSSSDGLQQRARNVNLRVRDGLATSVTLMDLPGPTTFETTADRLVASWASLPEHDEIDVSRWSFSDDFSRLVTYDFVLSRAFVAAAGLTSATLDLTDVPGFKPAWRHDPTLEQVVALDAVRGALPDSLISELSQDLPAPSPSAVGIEPRGRDAQRAMTLASHRAQLQRERRARAR